MGSSADTAGRSPGFYLLAIILVFAPLFRGANRPLPLLALEIGALALLAHLLWRPDFKNHLAGPLVIILALLFCFPLLQLLPLPPALWISLPGRDFYAQALTQANGGSPLEGWRAVSLVPWATETFWLALLPPLAVFLVAVGLPTRQLQALLILFLGMATFQALLGLVQYGSGPDSLVRFHNPYYRDSAVGTYINRDHLAGLLEMALPVGLALLTATLGKSSSVNGSYHSRRTLRHRLAAVLTALPVNRAALYGSACLAILLGLVFTRSRAGITLTMLGILLCMLIFARRLGGKNVYGLVGTLVFIGLGLAVETGLTPVLSRFTLEDPASDGRWSIFAGTLQAAAQFFPVGSGVGTFVEVYPRFYPPNIVFDGIINRAHNDYLESFLEGGLLGALLPLVLLGFYCYQWSRVWRPGTWSSFRLLQAGAGIGLLLLILHSAVDFNLHIPANAIFFAFLAAVFFHRDQQERTSDRVRQPSLDREDEVMKDAQTKGWQPPPLDNVPNPFAD